MSRQRSSDGECPGPEGGLHPTLVELDLEAFMWVALAGAEKAGQAGEVPIGAVLVIGGALVSRGRARHREHRSQLAHAEMEALLNGGESLWRHYREAVLFTTREPCPMCLGAAVMADVPHILYAAPDPIVHAADTVANNSYVRQHIKTYLGGILEQEAIAMATRVNHPYRHDDPENEAPQ